MKKHSWSEKLNARSRAHRGALVFCCLFAALVLVIGTGLSSQQTTQTQYEPEVSALASSSIAQDEANAASEASDTALKVTKDPDYGEVEEGKILVPVNNASDKERLDSALATSDLFATESVAAQDESVGFVFVNLEEGASMKQAITSLEKADFKAQPNYIYYCADESASSEAADSVENDVSVEGVTESDEALAASDADALAANSADVPATDDPLNDADVMAGLLGALSDPEGAAALSEQLSALATAADAASIDDDEASKQWALDSLDMYHAWAIQKCADANEPLKDRELSVAVIDSGCSVNHPDLSANINKDYFNSSTMQRGSDASIVEDNVGHGTHVAGIVAADTDNGIGVAGTSYNAGLVIIKATTGISNSFTTETLVRAYNWLLSRDDTMGGELTPASRYKVRVINLSLGGPEDTDDCQVNSDNLFCKKITEAKNAGILTVAAAGNTVTTVTPSIYPPYAVYPGDYVDCFTVINLKQDSSGSLDSSGTYKVSRSESSNYNVSGDTKTISAPGDMIYSTNKGTGYRYDSGTSMAAPAVSGVAALLFAQNPKLTPSQVQKIIEQTATDIGPLTGFDYQTGYGEVDAYKALQVTSAKLGLSGFEYKDVNTLSMDYLETKDLTAICPDNSTVPSSEYTWTSSDPSVLSVSGDKITANKRSGSATITGTYKSDDSEFAKLLTVSEDVSIGLLDFSKVDVTLVEPTNPKPDDKSYYYTGSQVRPKVIVTYGGEQLTENTDYIIEYGTNTNVVEGGTVTIKPGPNGGIRSKTVYFDIEPAWISNAQVAHIADCTYTGAEIYPGNTGVYPGYILATFNNTTLKRETDYTLSFENNIEPSVDQAVVVITGKGNFQGETTANFSIKKDISNATVSNIENYGQYYTGEQICPEPRVEHGGAVLEKGQHYSVKYSNNVNRGTATVTITGQGIYKGSIKQNFTIYQKDMSSGSDVKIDSIPDQVYTGSALKPDVTVRYNGKVLTKDVDYEIKSNSYSNNIIKTSATSRATVTIYGKGNFTGSKSITFEILACPLAGGYISGVKQMQYNNKAVVQDNIKIIHNGKTLTPTKDYQIRYENNKGPGTAKMVVEGRGNYTGSISANFLITAASSNTNNNSNTNTNNNTNNNSNNNSSNNNNNGALPTNNNSNNNSNNNNSNSNNSSNATTTYAFSSAPTVSGTWKKSGGKWWFKYDSATQKKLNSSKNYPANQWVKIKGKYYHFDGSGWMHAKWQKLNNEWYWFGSDGAMKTGWQKTGGKWYYMDPAAGTMKTGSLLLGNKTYYLDPKSGAMTTGWFKYSSYWYHFKKSGEMTFGWLKSGKTWYHLNNTTGIMDTAWFTDTDGKRYFLLPEGNNPAGAMITGWVQINGKSYYFNSSGVMQKNTWIGKYHLDADGVWDKTR